MVSLMENSPWPAIGAAVRARREYLGMSQTDLAAAADVSETTIRVLENARRASYRPANLRAIARALDWPMDAFHRMMAGRPPDEDLVERDTRPLEERVAELEAQLRALQAERAAEREQGVPKES